jgi:hypothetical protein
MGQKYAAYNAQGAITGFYDGAISPVPDGVNAIEITDAQWQTCLSNPGYTVADGALVAPTPPAPPTTAQLLVQSAQTALSTGLTITLSGTLTIAEKVFPTASVTTGKLAAVVTTLNTTNAFPGGATSYPMKDSTGAWHTFTVSQYKVVAGAIAAYVAALDLIIDGNPLSATALPAASVSLTV